MKKYLLFAEKPSLGRDLRNTYNMHKDELDFQIDFVSLSGHMCCLAKPDKYTDWNCAWKNIDLPMLPKKWKIELIPSMQNIYDTITEKINNNNYDGFIAAEDADREGNYIQYLLEQKLRLSDKQVYRIWLNEGLTDEKLLKAYKNMVDFHKDPTQVNLTKSAVLRGMDDWLMGMNFTTKYAVCSGNLFKIGRVKPSTIKIVYDNSEAIDNFVPETHYELKSVYDGFDGIYYDEDGNVSFKTEQDVLNFSKQLEKTAKIEKYESKITKKYAPSLYDLTKIQSEAGSLFGYSPDKTLSLVQSLYETHKLVSYPRSECEYVSTDQSKEFKNYLSVIQDIPELANYLSTITIDDILRVQKMNAYVNDKEVSKSSHTAIIPTGKRMDLSSLSIDEMNIYKMICRRFLCIFYGPCIENKMSIITNNNGYLFKTSGKTIVDKGFHEILGTKLKDKELPILKEGDVINVIDFIANGITTTPPERLTSSGLVDLMSNVQKLIEDKEMKQVLKDIKGIGTTATRANIVADILKDGYIKMVNGKKKEPYIVITDKGREYIHALKDYKFCSPIFTAELELKLREVAEGKASFADHEKEFINYIKETMNEMDRTVKFAPSNLMQKKICTCNCGGNIIDTKKAYSCDKNCGVIIWKEDKYFASKGKKMTEKIAKDLITNGETAPINFTSKNGKAYSAIIKVKFENGKTQYETEFVNNNK